ncbi:MAG: glutamyl-tRNA reductase [Planctomycetes bacterium]|nr:glutamyl-tRNA reductase [Planctomycetota bacterium]
MDRIGIAGLTLHETDVAGLERLARPSPERFELFARELADELGASELVLLTTCNRVEVVFARELGHLPAFSDRDRVAGQLGLGEADPLRERMHLLTGRDAVRHLFRVTCSLDSLVLGEDQILAQVREAYQRCERAGLVGRLLGALFEGALQVGKQVRTETELSRIPVSVVSLSLEAIAQRFAGQTPRVALVGAGAMAELVVKSASDHGVRLDAIYNRSLPNAARLAALCGAEARPLSQLVAPEGRGFDALISATAHPGFVLARAELLALAARTPLGEPLFAVDLALPRDLEPCDDPRVELIDLEALRSLAERQRARRSAAAHAAEALIEKKLDVFTRRATEAKVHEAIAEMQSESESVFERELARLFTGKLAGMPVEERRAIEHWARAAFGRVSHVPITALKRLAAENGAGLREAAEGAA